MKLFKFDGALRGVPADGVAEDATKRSKWQSLLCHLCSDLCLERGGDFPRLFIKIVERK